MDRGPVPYPDFIITLSCLSFRKYVWNFNLPNNIWTVRVRALIFHKRISCDLTFLWIPTFFFNHVALTFEFDVLRKTLTLILSFEQELLGVWYFRWVFQMTRPFHGHQHLWHCDNDLEFDLFFEYFSLAHKFWTGFLIFHLVFLVTRPSRGTNNFFPLTLEFDLLCEHFKLVNNS